MLLDANILLTAIDADNPERERCASFLTEALEGSRRVAIPWQTIGAFVRISTHPRVFRDPLDTAAALSFISSCLASPVAWTPGASKRTVQIFDELCRRHNISGNQVTDAQLAALAVEHGIAVATLDTDFNRFSELSVIRP